MGSSQAIDIPRRVVVLMSTYQGERFIREQLQSILTQLSSSDQILIRDDGSCDRTTEEVLAVSDPRITLVRGSNLGFGRSFLTLLAQVPADTDMVMFSDQDDVWLPDKVERAWQHLCALGGEAALYGSAQMLVDAELRPLYRTPAWPRGPSLANALTENIITGCTAALNRPALALLQRVGVPKGVLFHDWWLYLVVSAFGTVVYDERPALLYRQHGGNVIGHGAGWLARKWGMLRFLLRNDWVGILRSQVRAFLIYYGESLAPQTRDWILRYFHSAADGGAPRWRLVFNARRWRQAPVDEVALRMLLVAYKLHLWPLPSRRLDLPR